MTGFRTRFAPSPTGFLHLGHVVSAMYSRQMAGRDGTFLIRIEDIDTQRCLPRYEDALREDLGWLGIVSDEPVLRQSERRALYLAMRERLHGMGLLYPCTCSRAKVRAEGLGEAPDGSVVYGGACRSHALRSGRIPDAPHVWRLDMQAALERLGGAPGWRNVDGTLCAGQANAFGDVVIGRRESGISYHLCVTCDDALQNVTLVTRGADLLSASGVHRVLQALLGLPSPLYAHHPLLRDETGRKLSKRDGDEGIRTLRAHGFSARDVLGLAGDRLMRALRDEARPEDRPGAVFHAPGNLPGPGDSYSGG
ncbi:tRNA glutamyl-Q(34) synthetase GluQRS [Swaminathania salitolerans]|uniref:tRNA glutamyl-Q synthetase n=1 Tax=Swaminathania salitolerans TaxID=182838 RepID=A0A511BMP2_9PROT|nr:tRNA glutamyl-Q(34) synthetase GluQRS [Swaminathania salitolerans]GEL01596.1 tRNA glutamyl-Q synthetase [Swaminathania salitolerans]